MGYRNYSPSNGFLVQKNGTGDFTTIATALTAASSGDTIYIGPGTFTENPTLKAGVNLTAWGTDGSLTGGGNVIINGTCTLTAAGTVNISGIELQTNSSYFLTVSGSAASTINLNNCYLNFLNNTGIDFTSSSASSLITISNCSGNIATTGIGLFTMSSAGDLNILYSFIQNTGNSTTASTQSAGAISIQQTIIESTITTSGTATFAIGNGSFIQTAAINTTCVTTGGSGSHTIAESTFSSGTASALTINNTCGINNCLLNSSNTNAITGSGNAETVGIFYNGSSSTNNTTTQTTMAGTIQGLKGIVPTAGMLGEQIRSFVASGSAVSLSNTVAKTVTSIALTAGVWDVSGMVGFSLGTTTVPTLFQMSISVATNTVQNVYADSDNVLNSPTTLGTGFQPNLVVPAFRITLTAGATYYLVALCNFSTSTATAYGRISATRVG